MDAVKAVQFYKTEPECVVFSVEGEAGDAWKRLWIVYAGEAEGCGASRTLKLPDAKRYVLSDGENIYDEPEPVSDAKSVTVRTNSVSVYGEAWK